MTEAKPNPGEVPALPATPPAERPSLTTQVDPTARAKLVADGMRATAKALEIVADGLSDGTADFDDALRALPQLHKLLEHAERIESQADTTTSQAPLTIIFERAPGPPGVVVDVRRGAPRNCSSTPKGTP